MIGTDEELWVGLNDHVRATLGSVGISKMMSAGSDDAAKQMWTGHARYVLEPIATMLPVTCVGPALFDLGDATRLQLGIHDVHILVRGQPRWRTLMLNMPAALALLAVGRERWGDTWTRRLAASGSERPFAQWQPDPHLPSPPPWDRWIAQNPGGPAPYTTAATEAEARLATHAEQLGFDGIATIFRRFEGPTTT